MAYSIYDFPLLKLLSLSGRRESRCSKIDLKPTLHPFQNPLERIALQLRMLLSLKLLHAGQNQTNTGGTSWRKHHFFQAAAVIGQAQSHGHVKYLFAQFHHALQRTAAPGNDDSG